MHKSFQKPSYQILAMLNISDALWSLSTHVVTHVKVCSLAVCHTKTNDVYVGIYVCRQYHKRLAYVFCISVVCTDIYTRVFPFVSLPFPLNKM